MSGRFGIAELHDEAAIAAASTEWRDHILHGGYSTRQTRKYICESKSGTDKFRSGNILQCMLCFFEIQDGDDIGELTIATGNSSKRPAFWPKRRLLHTSCNTLHH